MHSDGERPSRTTTDEILGIIRQRRSIRVYRSEQVPHADVETLLEAAGWAPSGVNSQPWRFLVITDEAVLEEVNRITKRFISRLQPFLPVLTRVVRDLRNPDLRRVVRTAALPKVHVLHEAPALILIYTMGKPTHDETVACGMAAQNILLLAQAMGLGTGVLGITNALNFIPSARRLLHLRRGEKIVVGLTMGYPKKITAAPSRLPTDTLTTWL